MASSAGPMSCKRQSLLQFDKEEHSHLMVGREYVKEFEESVCSASDSSALSTTSRVPFPALPSPSFASFLGPDDDEYEVLVPAPYALVPDPSLVPPVCVVPAPPLPVEAVPPLKDKRAADLPLLDDASTTTSSAPTLPSLLDLITAKIAEMKLKKEMAKEAAGDVAVAVVVQDTETDKVSLRIRMFGFFQRVKNSFKLSFKHGKRRGISNSATSSRL